MEFVSEKFILTHNLLLLPSTPLNYPGKAKIAVPQIVIFIFRKCFRR